MRNTYFTFTLSTSIIRSAPRPIQGNNLAEVFLLRRIRPHPRKPGPRPPRHHRKPVNAMSRPTKGSTRILVFAAFAGIAAAQTTPISVCEMLNSATEHQHLTVRGEVMGEPHHGYYLGEEGLDGDPCPGWRRRFLTSPSALRLGLFSNFGVQLTQAQADSNLAFLRRLNMVSRGSVIRCNVTVEGVFARQPSFWMIRRSNGAYQCWRNDWSCIGVFVLKSIISEGPVMFQYSSK